jgi:hypothetical protein
MYRRYACGAPQAYFLPFFLHVQPPRRINARETYRAMLYVADDTSYFRDFCDIYLLIWRSPQHTV